MRRTIRRAVVLSVVLAVTSCGGDGPTQTGTSPFIGTWSLLAFEGQPASGVTMVFTQTSVTVTVGSESFSGTYTWDDTTDPKRLDVHIAGASPNPNHAIYIFTSSTLLVKFMDGAATRATAFSVEEGYDLQEFERL